jgi:hypothetical protein
MDHDQAMKMHAAERYLLDELSADERDDFEEHYFMCAKCADEVRSAFTLADNTHAVLKDEIRGAAAVSIKPRRFFSWWAWLRPAIAAPIAAALLLGITLYQSMVEVPRLERQLADATRPRVIQSVVARSATRGDDPVITISEHDQFLQLTLDINPTMPVSSYTCEVYDAAGALRFVVPANAPANGGSLNLLLPSMGLNPGRYLVRLKPISGSDSKSATHVDEHSFVLALK